MKTIFFLTSSILLLSSCQQYRYDVKYEECNGMTGSVSYVANRIAEPDILDGRYHSLPELGILGENIRNVCDFTYVRTPITK